ncbi:MFS transporter [Halospeciosus flavus]|uniref:MFS transporter n=2 Tax=Halospeciosus flavus TaxID=3032283 RepID=A0ABD5YZ90_9EURY
MSVRTRLGAATTVAIIALTGLIVISELYVSIPLTPTVQRVFDVSQAQASWVGTAFGLAYGGGVLVFGPLSDRYGRKTIIVPGLLVLAVSTFAVGFSPSYEILIGLRIVQGLAAATFPAAAVAYIGEVLPESIRATGIGVVTTGVLAAGIVGQVYADAVMLVAGWEWVFWGLAAVYVVFIALLYALPQTEGEDRQSEPGLLTVYARMGRLLQNRVLLSAYFGGFAVLFTFVGMYSGLAPYLQTAFGVSSQQLLLVRAAGIPGMLLSPFAGRPIARYGSSRVASGSFVLAAGGLGLEAIAGSLPVLVVGSIVFVTGIAAAVPSLISLIGETVPSARGTAVALYVSILFIGASVGPLLPTSLQSIGFVGLCGLLAVVLLVAAGILVLSRNGSAPQLADNATPGDVE